MKIIEKDGTSIVKFDKPAVGIICYDLDQNSVLNNIGVVKETNALFDKGYTENLIMGGVETEDSSLLERAAKELKEEAGLEVADVTKWGYLGEIYTSKISPDPIYLFSVNVTGLTPQPPTGDGQEELISFSMIPVQDAIAIGDSVLTSAFFKLFMTIYSKELKPITI